MRLRPWMVYVASGVLFTWPLILHPTTRLAAPVGPGDTFLNLWILGWGMQTILTDPGSLVTGRAFNEIEGVIADRGLVLRRVTIWPGLWWPRMPVLDSRIKVQKDAPAPP